MKALSVDEACNMALPLMRSTCRVLVDNGIEPAIAADMAASFAAFHAGLWERGISIPESDGWAMLVAMERAARRAGYAVDGAQLSNPDLLGERRLDAMADFIRGEPEVRPGDPAPLAGPADEDAGVNGLGRPGSPESGG